MMKGVIFDLDGVIVSTDVLHCMAWLNTCNQWGIPFFAKDNDLLRGVSRMDSVDIICRIGKKTLTMEEKERFAKEKNDRYVQLLNNLTKEDVLPGVLELIKELSQHNIMTAIGSSSKNAKRILERIGMEDSFDAIVDGTMITHSKPDPEVFLKAASLLGLKPEECVVVEDAESGIIAAKRAGCMAAAVGAAKESGKADLNLESTKDLIRTLKI
jgi:beta-phosphoglucomutase